MLSEVVAFKKKPIFALYSKTASQVIDQLTYNYTPGTNRLQSVVDARGVVLSDDIGSSSYTYDAIGNLNKDIGEEIDHINWTVSGKVREVVRDVGSQKSDLRFYYDAMGNRVLKEEIPATAGAAHKLTWYMRDASGNVMATYSSPQTTYNATKFRLKELNIYGSSRLGMLVVNTTIANMPEPGNSKMGVMYKGNKFYELSNHLGNVLSVITDRLLEEETTPNSHIVDYFKADLVSSSDYYPFGSQMLGRGKLGPANGYRYGFNGQEKETDITGSESHYTAEFWMYDSRLGRRWNMDPVVKSYRSNYSCFSNNPILRVDPSGNTDYINSEGVKIGDDGNLGNGRVILVTDEATIIKIQNSEAFDVTNLPENSYFELPPYADRQKIKDQVDGLPKYSYYEVGGQINEYVTYSLETFKTLGTGTVYTKWKDGDVVNSPKEIPSINPNNKKKPTPPKAPTGQQNEITNLTPKYIWHSHPNGLWKKGENGLWKKCMPIDLLSTNTTVFQHSSKGTEYGDGPSDSDYKSISGYKGSITGIIVGTNNKLVTFYNAKKRTAAISWDTFFNYVEEGSRQKHETTTETNSNDTTQTGGN